MSTKWTEGDYIPRSGLLGWHSADRVEAYFDGWDLPSEGGTIGTLFAPATNRAQIVEDALNGQPALNFNGTNTRPNASLTGSFAIRHTFVVAMHRGTSFGASFRGLLTTGSASSAPQFILVGDTGEETFVNNSWGSGYKFRRFDVEHPEAAQPGVFNSQAGIYEVSRPTSMDMDTIQIGVDRTNLDRVWDGHWFEQIIYNRVLEDEERRMIYEYFALKYQLWRQVASGLNVWPFQPNWPLREGSDKLVLRSTAVSGARKARSKSVAKRAIEAQFIDRQQEEMDAATAFWDEHYPGSEFIFRDDSLTPARDTEVHFTGQGLIRDQQSYQQASYSIQLTET